MGIAGLACRLRGLRGQEEVADHSEMPASFKKFEQKSIKEIDSLPNPFIATKGASWYAASAAKASADSFKKLVEYRRAAALAKANDQGTIIKEKEVTLETTGVLPIAAVEKVAPLPVAVVGKVAPLPKTTEGKAAPLPKIVVPSSVVEDELELTPSAPRGISRIPRKPTFRTFHPEAIAPVPSQQGEKARLLKKKAAEELEIQALEAELGVLTGEQEKKLGEARP